MPETPTEAIEAIFAQLPARMFLTEFEDRSGQDAAARLAFAYARNNPTCDQFLRTARRFLCTKIKLNSHEIKFPVAMFDDLQHISPKWRPHMLARSVHFLHGRQSEDNPVLEQARSMLTR